MIALELQRKQQYLDKLERQKKALKYIPEPVKQGVLTRVVGLTLEAEGCHAPIGSFCHVETINGGELECEVVGFSENKLLLMPTGDMQGIRPNAAVRPVNEQFQVPVGFGLLGRVIDASGRSLDGLGPLDISGYRPLISEPINPLLRNTIDEPLDVGVKAINAMLTVGRGQRMGLFAGSGVGKSMLLGMMTRFTEAEIIVVGLVGERGREVKEFIEQSLGAEGMARAVVVAAPADQPPLIRLRGAWVATSIAEYFRDQGLKVLLLIDSLTRFAQAQREIALAVGEPPATKGYPPSVFAKLPQLVERAGNGSGSQGSITAFYTVLAEGDDQSDPIVDSARAILDGHVVLSRELADSGHYPAIDIEQSISRAFTQITDAGHQKMVQQLKQLYSSYQRNRDLINIGAYQPGADALVDTAMQKWPQILEFLQQPFTTSVDFKSSMAQLELLLNDQA
ncbi:MAG: flagellar protein export ATPase FliI [Pseudomonadales bacterium]|nr:flagellar protein export ATPase FliI [Pseudomonadales bacterium]